MLSGVYPPPPTKQKYLLPLTCQRNWNRDQNRDRSIRGFFLVLKTNIFGRLCSTEEWIRARKSRSCLHRRPVRFWPSRTISRSLLIYFFYSRSCSWVVPVAPPNFVQRPLGKLTNWSKLRRNLGEWTCESFWSFRCQTSDSCIELPTHLNRACFNYKQCRLNSCVNGWLRDAVEFFWQVLRTWKNTTRWWLITVPPLLFFTHFIGGDVFELGNCVFPYSNA